MKKPDVELSGPSARLLSALRENILIITGRIGGAITNTKQIKVAYPSTGIDVASVAGTFVTTKAEFDQLVQKVADLEGTLRGLITRLNTP